MAFVFFPEFVAFLVNKEEKEVVMKSDAIPIRNNSTAIAVAR